MCRSSLAAIVLLLGSSLSSGPLPLSARSLEVARPSRTEAPEPSWGAAWEVARSKLAALLKNGSGIDPFGLPAAIASTRSSGPGDNGSGVDPFGGK